MFQFEEEDNFLKMTEISLVLQLVIGINKNRRQYPLIKTKKKKKKNQLIYTNLKA